MRQRLDLTMRLGKNTLALVAMAVFSSWNTGTAFADAIDIGTVQGNRFQKSIGDREVTFYAIDVASEAIGALPQNAPQ